VAGAGLRVQGVVRSCNQRPREVDDHLPWRPRGIQHPRVHDVKRKSKLMLAPGTLSTFINTSTEKSTSRKKQNPRKRNKPHSRHETHRRCAPVADHKHNGQQAVVDSKQQLRHLVRHAVELTGNLRQSQAPDGCSHQLHGLV